MGDQFAHADPDKLSGLFNSAKYEPEGMGYCLSGGGYKAAAFHLGGLLRLNEVGLLSRIKRISSVSGGSIAAGFLASRWTQMTFASGVATDFGSKFAAPLKDFLTEVNLDVFAGVADWFDPSESAADKIADGYRKHLKLDGITLQHMPSPASGAPRFELVATNYELNSLWRFNREYAADYRVGRIDAPTFPLSRVIAASSAFPPFFCPLTLDFKGQKWLEKFDKDKGSGDFLKRALLCDGGIYDNMGLEPIWKRYGVLLVSNSGDPLDEADHPKAWPPMMRRIVSMMHRQAENNRVRMLMVLATTENRKVAYWPLRNSGENYPKKSGLTPLPAKEIEAAQTEGVRLWSLGEKAFRRLANHGYYLADCAIQSYLPPPPVAAPAAYPYPTT